MWCSPFEVRSMDEAIAYRLYTADRAICSLKEDK